MGKKVVIELVVPEGLKEGDTFRAEVELPEVKKAIRGKGATTSGKTPAEMTDEELKRELINANSVLYKAKQRQASEETINVNQARVDAAKAEKEKRAPVIVTVDKVIEDEAEAEVDTDTVAEI